MRVNNQKAKQKFRGTKVWKEFRARVRHEQINDPVTGQKLSRLANLHHMNLDETHYEDLSIRDNFVFLNRKTHETVHFLFSKVHPRQWRKRILALIKILKQMEKINSR